MKDDRKRKAEGRRARKVKGKRKRQETQKEGERELTEPKLFLLWSRPSEKL